MSISGDDAENFKGGDTGGSILDGMLQVDDETDERPVLSTRTRKAIETCVSIVLFCAEKSNLRFVVRDGLINVATHIDLTLMFSDRRVD